jgi:hypothetical protein
MKRFSTISSIVAITVLLAACGDKGGNTSAVAPVATASAKVELDPTQGVARDPSIKYSLEDCGYVGNIVASMQRGRNAGAGISFVEEHLAEVKANSPRVYDELMDIANSIWNKPVNQITPEQAEKYGLDFCGQPVAPAKIIL